MNEVDKYGRPLNVGDLVMYSVSGRYSTTPKYGVYDGHTGKTYRFKKFVRGYGGKERVTTTNLHPFLHGNYANRDKRAPCVLIAGGPVSDEQLLDFHDNGFPVQ